MPYERSQYGCWTCRVRKKKCDEYEPICVTCSSRGISCYGYGPKPDWLDGGAMQKRILAELRSEIKVMLRQRKDAAKQQLVQRQQNLLRYTHEASTTQSEIHYAPYPDFPAPPSTLSISISPTDVLNPIPLEVQSDSQVSPGLKFQDGPIRNALSFAPFLHIACGDVDELEKSMLMNYLDHVFPKQFSCYVPQVLEMGRGWLLALLTRTKALFHVAIALSALHVHRSLLDSGGRETCVESTARAIDKHHGLAIQELQLQLKDLRNSSDKGLVEAKRGIEILACTIQMISFELLRGGTENWQIHLQAASTIIPPLVDSTKSGSMPPIFADSSAPNLFWGPSTSSTTMSSTRPLVSRSVESVAQALKDLPPAIDEIARDFLVGTFIWFDILASASTRRNTCLHGHAAYLNVCCSGEAIELDKLMGCENWVMILIARISALEEQKRQLEVTLYRNKDQNYRYRFTDLLDRGGEIETALYNGLSMNEKSLNRLREETSSALSSTPNLPRRDILYMTRIFAHSALIYLHVVLLGADPNLPPISSRVSLSLTSFRDLSDLKLLRNLIWPLCIAGCMAQRDQEACFRELIEQAGFDAACPENIWKAYEVMKECWRLRRANTSEVDWTKAMESAGLQVLLV